MKCPNCGAEMGNDKVCSLCGLQLAAGGQKEREQVFERGCPRCGSLNVKFSREKLGEHRGKNGSTVIRSTVGLCGDCGYTWQTAGTVQAEKKGNTWLWVLGWICFFPIPLTILMLRKKDMNPVLKYGVIAIAWLACLLLVLSGYSSDIDAQDAGNEQAAGLVEARADKSQERIVLEGGVPGEYGTEVRLNASDGTVYTKLEFDIPAGTYLVSNPDCSPWIQFNVYSKEITVVDGNDEQHCPEGLDPILLKKGESATVTIPEGYLVYVVENDSVTLEKIE